MPSLIHDDIERTYALFAADAPGASPRPLVLLLHGGGGTGTRIAEVTRFGDWAAREGFALLCPDGYERHWNDGREVPGVPAHARNVDDVGFLARLLEAVCAAHPIDPSRVYAAGASNGAMMVYRLACELGERLAAIAAVMGTLPIGYGAPQAPRVRMPVLMMHGTADLIVPFQGGAVRVQSQGFGAVQSYDNTLRYWIAHNDGRLPGAFADWPETGSARSMPVRHERYEDAEGLPCVESFVIEGGGHTWPGGEQYMGEWLIGETADNLDATAEIGRFFREHRRTPNK